MIMLFFLSVIFLTHSHKSNNPLTSCLFLVLSLLCITPVLVVLTVAWYVIIMNLLFLSGVFVLVIYTVSTAGVMHKKVGVVVLLILISMMFSSMAVFYVPSFMGLSVLFMSYNLGLLLFILLFMVFLILFSSYMVSGGAAMRSM